jgi:hypothetical protein
MVGAFEGLDQGVQNDTNAQKCALLGSVGRAQHSGAARAVKMLRGASDNI